MAKLTIEEILAAIDELTVIELNDLVKAAEEKYLSLIHIFSKVETILLLWKRLR